MEKLDELEEQEKIAVNEEFEYEESPSFTNKDSTSEDSTEKNNLDYKSRTLENLTGELVINVDDTLIEENNNAIIKEIEQVEKSFDVMSIEQRLELKKKELQALEMAIKEEDKYRLPQRTIQIEYYEKMNPRKIFPMIVTIPPVKNGNNHQEDDSLRITPIFPGCYVTPHEESLLLKSEEEEIVEFSITPLIGQGSIQGKVGVCYKNHSLININTIAKIRNFVGVTISGILAFLFGIFPFLLKIFGYDINESLANGFNATFSTTLTSTLFMWLEIALLFVFTGLMISFI